MESVLSLQTYATAAKPTASLSSLLSVSCCKAN